MRSIALVLVLVASFCSYAGADDHKEKEHKGIAPVTNELYKKSCGSCHFAYQPGLLPQRSWTKIIEGAHSGGDLKLDKASKEQIKAYLVRESAENSSAERSRKIVRSIPSSTTPVRVTDLQYIQKKHRKINPDIFKRPTIRSSGNCKACHQKAEQGIYEDDDVVIPSK
ncbi:MAG: cytochrome C [Thermodesulfovibrio sp.]|nr:cytochrome C [Thermodesulfovibrio sp.]